MALFIPISLVLILIVAFVVLVRATAAALLEPRPRMETRRPDAFGLLFEEVAFPAWDGLPLAGWWVPADGARGTVVFCHGQAGSKDRDTEMAPIFHRAGYNVLMFDFRAHGDSAGRLVTFGPAERLDLLGALSWLQARGVERVGAMGWSMGAAVAIDVAADDRRIAAVVADSAFASLERVIAGQLLKRGLPWPVARLVASLALREAGRRAGVDLAAREPRRRVGHGFPCPLLLVQGDADPYLPLADAEALAHAAGERAGLWRVPGAGHRQARELLPEEYARRVIAFFEANL